MSNCKDCVFNTATTSYQGDIDSPYVIIDDGPTVSDVAKNTLYAQREPKMLLDKALKASQLLYEDFLVIPAYKCLAQKKTPARVQRACAACREGVLELVSKKPRKIIIAFGNAAMWSITGDKNLKITQERGKVIETPLAEKGILISFSPAHIVRGGGNTQQFCRDLEYAMELIDKKQVTVFDKKPQFVEGKYKVLDTAAEVDRFIKYLHSIEPGTNILGIDLETDGFEPRLCKVDPPYTLGVGIICAGFSLGKNKTVVIPGHLLRDELFQTKIPQGYHNGKFDIRWLWYYGFKSAQVHHDSMLMSYLLDERGGIHDLEQVGNDWLQATNYKGMLEKYLPSRKHSYANIPSNELFHYQAIDAHLTQELCVTLYERIRSDVDLLKAYNNVIIPGSYFLSRMEENGIAFDSVTVENNIRELTAEANEYEDIFKEEARKVGFEDINMRSPKQVTAFLYDTLKLAPEGSPTGADFLDTLDPHPAVGALKRYRKVHKLLSTFVLPLKEKQVKGRLHSTFKLHGTTTGRLSSNKPNLQNIPRDIRIRSQFSASPGHVIVDCDLSQAELRVLACLSNDKNMIEIFASGRSFHDEVATRLFGPNFNKEQKMIAKNVNFGIIYGITEYGLKDQIDVGAKRLGSIMTVTHSEAREWIDGWYEQFPQAARFITVCREMPVRMDTIVSPFGRKRRFTFCGREKLYAMQNEAANFPEQSTAHDITLMSGIETIDKLQEQYNARIVNEVHDCLLIDTPDDMVTIFEVAYMVTQAMQTIPKRFGLTQVPFTSEPDICYNWGIGKTLDMALYERRHEFKGMTYKQFTTLMENN